MVCCQPMTLLIQDHINRLTFSDTTYRKHNRRQKSSSWTAVQACGTGTQLHKTWAGLPKAIQTREQTKQQQQKNEHREAVNMIGRCVQVLSDDIWVSATSVFTQLWDLKCNLNKWLQHFLHVISTTKLTAAVHLAPITYILSSQNRNSVISGVAEQLGGGWPSRGADRGVAKTARSITCCTQGLWWRSSTSRRYAQKTYNICLTAAYWTTVDNSRHYKSNVLTDDTSLRNL